VTPAVRKHARVAGERRPAARHAHPALDRRLPDAERGRAVSDRRRAAARRRDSLERLPGDPLVETVEQIRKLPLRPRRRHRLGRRLDQLEPRHQRNLRPRRRDRRGGGRRKLPPGRPGEREVVMIKLYHAERTRSFRIVWLLEELGIPYQLEKKG